MGVVYEEGDNVTFSCTSLGGSDNSIQWLKDGESFAQEINGSSSRLKLTDISVTEDGAIYTCVASNAAGNGSASVSLLISPVFVADPTDEEIINGTVISFICNAIAFPDPSYIWLRVGGDLSESAVGRNTTMLTLYPAVFGDQGIYYCTATSSGVSVSSQTAILTSQFIIVFLFELICFPFQYLLNEEYPSHHKT